MSCTNGTGGPQPRLEDLVRLLRTMDDDHTIRDAADVFWSFIEQVNGQPDLERCVERIVQSLSRGVREASTQSSVPSPAERKACHVLDGTRTAWGPLFHRVPI